MLTDHQADQLIEQAQAGSEQALADLFDSFRDQLRKMVLVRMDPRVRSRFDPDDVLQDAFVELARRLDDYNRGSDIPFFVWLRLHTAQRLAQLHRMHLGAEKRDAGREIRIVNQLPNVSTFFLASKLAGHFTSVDRNLIREEIQQKLQDTLNRMDEDDREVLAMRHYEELSTEEVASILGVTRSGVLKRHTRALRKLRQAIQSDTDMKI